MLAASVATAETTFCGNVLTTLHNALTTYEDQCEQDEQNYSIRFARPHQPIKGSLDCLSAKSLDRLIDRSHEKKEIGRDEGRMQHLGMKIQGRRLTIILAPGILKSKKIQHERHSV